MAGSSVVFPTTAHARWPPQLAKRLATLRTDRDARETLEERVEQALSEQRRAEVSSGLSARQQLVKSLTQEAGAAAPSPSPTSRRAPKSGRRAQAAPLVRQRASDEVAVHDEQIVESLPSPGPVRAVRDSGRAWLGPLLDGDKHGGRTAGDVIERARLHRIRDPLEVSGGGEGALVRRREKGLELGGAFRTGLGGSEAERLASVAHECAPLEKPLNAPRHTAVGHLAAAQWVGGDFVQTKVAQSTVADTSLLAEHRAPYVDAHTRELATYRLRDRVAEVTPRSGLSARSYDESPRGHADPWRGIRPPIKAYHLMSEADACVGQIDEIEMQTARLLLSTGLSIHRPRGGRL